jgi:peptidoglycan lytic transglycosylase
MTVESCGRCAARMISHLSQQINSMDMVIQVERKPVFSTLLLIASIFASAEASATASRPGRDTHASAQEKDKGTKSKGAQANGTRTGLASYYGKGLHGRKTASGEAFDKADMVAAHPTYPLGTRVKVTNLNNGRSEEVRINDRGPTRENQKRGVIIDLSEQAATKLGFRKKGKTRVKVEVLEWGEKAGKEMAARLSAD